MKIKKDNEREKISELRPLFIKGIEKARESFSRWLSKDIELCLSEVITLKYDEITSIVGKPDRAVAIVFTRIIGKFSGTQVFIFPQPEATSLVNFITKNDAKTNVEWNELERSILEETSNIIGTAFINLFAEKLNIKVAHEPPVFTFDMMDSIMQTVLSNYTFGKDDVVLLKTRFSLSNESTSNIYFFILFDPVSLRQLEEISND